MARCEVLSAVLGALERLAPTRLAAKWDNVGLLVDARASARAAGAEHAYRILLTNDLVPAVLEDAVSRSANLIVTYHPTPFAALKQFRLDNPAARVVLTCAANNIAVFSPHTSWDAAPGGLTDWLLEGIAKRAATGLASSRPVKPAEDPAVAAAGGGDGRIGTLAMRVSLSEVIEAVKEHCGVPHVQVALPAALLPAAASGADSVRAAAATLEVGTIAVCAGSGASVLSGARADVLVTGEMSHHEVLAANAAGAAVILTHHSKSERGYLPVFAERLRGALTELKRAGADAGGAAAGGASPADAAAVSGINFEIFVSAVDADPLTIL